MLVLKTYNIFHSELLHTKNNIQPNFYERILQKNIIVFYLSQELKRIAVEKPLFIVLVHINLSCELQTCDHGSTIMKI